MYEYALHLRKYEDFGYALFYIDKALKKKPNDINYKYQRFKIMDEMNEDQNHLVERRIFNRNNQWIPRYKPQKLKAEMAYKCKLLLSGYLSCIASSLIIPVDVERICFAYLIGSFSANINDFPFNSCFNQFGLSEIKIMLFNALCPGMDEALLLFTITKLINLMHNGIQSTQNDRRFNCVSLYYLSILSSITSICSLHSIISLIEDENERNVNLKHLAIAPTKLARVKYSKYSIVIVSFLQTLFEDHEQFYRFYVRGQ